MRRFLIEHGLGQTRLALIEGERLVEFRLAEGEDRHRPGSLHLGRVISVDPGLAAAFVEIGADRPGLLPLRDARRTPPSTGDAILVQVTRASLEDKGVRLSARPVLAGRGIALRPGRSGIAFAANLSDPPERERIRELLRSEFAVGLGLNVDRRALDLPAGRLRAEARRLIGVWRAIADRQASVSPPALLWDGPDAVGRALLDWAVPGMEIVCNDSALAASVAARLVEDLADAKATPRLDRSPMLLEKEGVEEQLEAALRPEAPIPGGGLLLIEPGRTLTAVDVNSAGADRRPREVNLAAAEEIAHQLRLRAIGGLVVIDFIDLRTPSARGAVLERLAQSLSRDPVGCELAGATRLGLVELTRRRAGPNLAELLTEPCGLGGSGRVRRVEAIGGELLRRIATEALARPGGRFALVCAPEIAQAFMGPLAEGRAELERRLGRRIEIAADPSLPREGSHISARSAGGQEQDGA
ncbi:MAG TPA: ribonuclease E/G [Alphaproteobacteria bacterium]|nr:ribonuclease E/G [Alphaproteobacteria bacterium]